MRVRTKAPSSGGLATRSWRRPAVMGAVSALLAAPMLTVVGPAQALDATRVGPNDPSQHGWPAYFTDDSGVALQLCDDGTAACLATGATELAPVDGEGFYWMATTDLSAPGIDISIEFAAEAAWLSPTQPITFDRVRIRGHSDSAGDIVVDTPYGPVTVTADDPAASRNVNFTEDIGCDPLPACNFADMASSPDAHITSWITSTTPPAGRLGDGVTSEAATVAGAPAIAGVGGVTTDQWVVMGKLADPNAVSLPTAVDFGNVRRAATRTVRLRNLGTGPLTLGGSTLTGSTAFTQTATSTCTAGRVLAVGQGCAVGLRYRPNGAKQAAATLRIRDDSPAGVRTVRVTARSAAVMSVRQQLRFRSVRAHKRGVTRRIVVTNTGGLPMTVRSVRLAGRNPGQFAIRKGAPRVCKAGARVPAGAQCAVYVGFEPRSFGNKRANLVIRSNALPTSRTVALTGFGR